MRFCILFECEREWDNMKRSAQAVMYAVVCCFAAVSLLTSSGSAKQGISDALMLACNVVIPSLFPFMVLTGCLVRSGAAAALTRPTAPALTAVFRLPTSACGAVLMSFISGYPSGAAMTAELLESGEITQKQAERMLTFCVNAGPAMILFAVGDALFSSRAAGIVLLVCHILASVIIGAVGARFAPKQSAGSRAVESKPPHSLADAFVEATSDASSQMLVICGFVAAFGCITAMLPKGLEPLSAVLEVTRGTACLAERGAALPVISAALGFSGVSVMCQVAALSKGAIRPWVLVCSRAAHAAVSFLLCKAALRLFPGALECVSFGAQTVLAFSATSVPLTLSMLACAAIMLSTGCKEK